MKIQYDYSSFISESAVISEISMSCNLNLVLFEEITSPSVRRKVILMALWFSQRSLIIGSILFRLLTYFAGISLKFEPILVRLTKHIQYLRLLQGLFRVGGGGFVHSPMGVKSSCF